MKGDRLIEPEAELGVQKKDLPQVQAQVEEHEEQNNGESGWRWLSRLNEKEREYVEFAKEYIDNPHMPSLAYRVLAKLAELLDEQEERIDELEGE